MTVRAALLSLLLTAAPAFSQTATPTGSLTLMSRPAGVSFRIVGDRVVVGRTPMTLDRGMAGRYRVYGSGLGYERWHRTLVLDGLSADTLWMTLRPKNALLAGGRSVLMPGWGQFYDDHGKRGLFFLVAGLVAGGTFALAEFRYRDRVDEYNAADVAYQAAGTPEAFEARRHASERTEDAWRLRIGALGTTAGVWGLSVLDAMWSVPRPVGAVLLGAATGPGGLGRRAGMTEGPHIAVTLARVKF